jgi:hypothetical protein
MGFCEKKIYAKYIPVPETVCPSLTAVAWIAF